MENFEIWQNCALFCGLSEKEISLIIKKAGAYTKEFLKNERIINAGDFTENIGVLLSGSLYILTEDYWGNVNIINEISPGDMFMESFCLSGTPCDVNVLCKTQCTVLFLSCRHLLSENDPASVRALKNLLSCVAKKNAFLNSKLRLCTLKTTRQKLLSYLSSEKRKAGSQAFKIPFNLSRLSEYLCVERSAMSTELNRLKKEGYLDYEKNVFTLIDKDSH